MSNPLSGILSPATRKALYAVYGVLGLAVGAVQAWCAASDAHQPSWLNGATAVLAYVGVALGFTAASNVPTPDTDEPGGGGDAGWSTTELCLVVIAAVLLLWAFGVVPR